MCDKHLFDAILCAIIDTKGIDEITKRMTQLAHPQKNSQTTTFVFVDLGNIHDVLPILDRCDSPPTFTVIAFADKYYRGYGVNPRSRYSLVERATEQTKNAADTRIVTETVKICSRFYAQNTQCNIHIITKDKGFYELIHIAREMNQNVQFHNSGTDFFEYCVREDYI